MWLYKNKKSHASLRANEDAWDVSYKFNLLKSLFRPIFHPLTIWNIWLKKEMNRILFVKLLIILIKFVMNFTR
jgi:hypothetical protein